MTRSIAVVMSRTWTAIRIIGIVVSILGIWGKGPVDLTLETGLLLLAAVGMSLASTLSDVHLARQSRKLRDADLPWGHTLTTPKRIALAHYAFVASWGLFLSVVLSTLGWHRVGIGSAAVWLVLAWLAITGATDHVESLLFGKRGVSVQVKGTRFSIQALNVRGIESVGPSHHQMTVILLKDVEGVVRTAEPASGRRHVEEVIGKDGKLVLSPWTGGLDGTTLARFIYQALRE
jgi:hypothetical protein